MAEDQTNAEVIHRSELTPELAVFRVRPEGWELPDFTPGQFAVLGLPDNAPRIEGADADEDEPTGKLIKRAYSISSSSKQKEYVEFFVALVRSGALTPRIFALKEGDGLFLSKKFSGMFTLDMVPAEANIILAATGTGVAPYMSMIRSLFSASTKRRFALLHGARHSWDLGYRQELSTLSYERPNFAYLPVISRVNDEKTPWIGTVGYVQDLWRNQSIKAVSGFVPTPADTHIFICGNPSMVEDMAQMVKDDGYVEQTKDAPGQVHVERYW